MEMKIDTQKLIQLRNSKAWSQQHLADVSGLSLRTIQRIEKTESASPESVKAIAAAFDGTPDMLLTASLPDSSPMTLSTEALVSEDKGAWSRQNVVWILGALVLSFVAAAYWSQSVNATNSNGTVVEAGAPVQVNDMALQQGKAWLQLVDDGLYAQSWDVSSAIFKTSVSQAKWIEALQLIRQPLGVTKSRELAKTQAPSTLPGLPDGDYLILTFSTSFDGNASLATETLSLVKINGEYRTIGYFIR